MNKSITRKAKKIVAAVLSVVLSVSLLCSCSYLTSGFDSLMAYFGLKRVLVDYEEMTYERPDFELLNEKIDALTEEISNGKNTKRNILKNFEEVLELFLHKAYTMESIAFIEFAKDITDKEKSSEYYLVSEENGKLSVKMENLFAVCAASEYKKDFETYLGEGYLDAYTDRETEYPEEFERLISHQSELLADYSGYIAELSVEYDGTVYRLSDINGIEDDGLYYEVTDAFCKKYNSVIASLYVDLVKTRKSISEYFGFDDYVEYSLFSYGRDYSSEQLSNYCECVKKTVAPVYAELLGNLGTSDSAVGITYPEKSFENAGKLVKSMSDELNVVFSDMRANHLYTVGASDKMYYGSFETYFGEYETPYIFVNGNGYSTDILTVIHEFGHFASSYYNYGNVGSNDESEVASQALELISTMYLDGVFGNGEADGITKYEMLTLASAIVECSLYTEFENRVYAEKNITAERCNEIFSALLKEYGMDDGTVSDGAWIFINHLIEYPFYMIGYSVSADVSIQLYEKCKEKGSLAPYLEFIKRAYQNDFSSNIEESGLVHPFSPERAEKTASFIAEHLK